MKQTAVDWLESELNALSRMGLSIGKYSSVRKNIFEQAKEIEKEQIISSVIYGNTKPSMVSSKILAEQYYNETFKSDQ